MRVPRAYEDLNPAQALTTTSQRQSFVIFSIISTQMVEKAITTCL
jgi:hypothetical protein